MVRTAFRINGQYLCGRFFVLHPELRNRCFVLLPPLLLLVGQLQHTQSKQNTNMYRTLKYWTMQAVYICRVLLALLPSLRLLVCQQLLQQRALLGKLALELRSSSGYAPAGLSMHKHSEQFCFVQYLHRTLHA